MLYLAWRRDIAYKRAMAFAPPGWQWTVAVLALGVACSASAQPAAANPYCNGPLKVALYEHGVLYRSETRDGIDLRLVELLAQRTGCSIQQDVLPRARIWNEFQAGKLDIVTAAMPTPERKAIAFMLPYVQSHNVLLVRSAAAVALQSTSEFEKGTLRLGVVRSFYYESTYKELVDKLRVQQRVAEATDMPELMRFLERGMVDAVLSYPTVYPRYIDAQRLEREFVALDWAPKDEVVIGALALSRKTFTAEQARLWDKLMVSLVQDGTQYRILRNFLPAKQAQGLIYAGPRSLD